MGLRSNILPSEDEAYTSLLLLALALTRAARPLMLVAMQHGLRDEPMLSSAALLSAARLAEARLDAKTLDAVRVGCESRSLVTCCVACQVPAYGLDSHLLLR